MYYIKSILLIWFQELHCKGNVQNSSSCLLFLPTFLTAISSSVCAAPPIHYLIISDGEIQLNTGSKKVQQETISFAKCITNIMQKPVPVPSITKAERYTWKESGRGHHILIYCCIQYATCSGKKT